MPFISSIPGNFSPIGRGLIPFNNATGGTITTTTISGFTYRVHTFPVGTTTFTVLSAARPFEVLIGAGGGGGGGSFTYYGLGAGSGGVYQNLNMLLSVQSYSVVVGGAGSGGGPGSNGGSGGNSSFNGVVSGGGGFGAGGLDSRSGGTGGTGANGGESGASGRPFAGAFANTSANNATSLSIYSSNSWSVTGRSAGGSGGTEPTGSSSGASGQAGIVVVRYRIT